MSDVVAECGHARIRCRRTLGRDFGLVIGPVLLGASILVVRGLTGRTDEVDLGEVPALLVVITTVAGGLLGAAGGAVRARRG